MIIGDYHYGRSDIGGIRYMLVKCGDFLQTVFVPSTKTNPIQQRIWTVGDPMTEQVIDIVGNVEWDYELIEREKNEP